MVVLNSRFIVLPRANAHGLFNAKNKIFPITNFAGFCCFDDRADSGWRPKLLTSLTVMPSTPIVVRASFTSSSLNGLIIASIFFMFKLELQAAIKR